MLTLHASLQSASTDNDGREVRGEEGEEEEEEEAAARRGIRIPYE